MNRGALDSTTERMRADLAHQDRDAVLLWLRHGGADREGRVRFATKVLVAGLWVQAALLGLVRCARCGDLGCDWCRSRSVGHAHYAGEPGR